MKLLKKKTKHLLTQSGFTLIEMLIVLIIISILLLIAVPNLAKNRDIAIEKGCEATKDLLKAQVYAYEIETGNKLTDIQKLVDDKYVDSITCPDGKVLTLSDLDK
ncbi:competence type IV pilus major pilin ComGC [Evansella cellulosilytica]|uniref:ComG operon protein 3 n=1 Tax=Evansella cellulosilytica (strain ATCC 21833 / DSM 2522 / FERM P-1141 / JCM 9156 / N-4) TaxID=649639 RepID=E6TWZ0_EVAC2|nr:competence type IV pilus major pilin ComGC [Evansella cellulosilytica]ADU29940.1 competence protein ComGC-like protein [Evansella cellulosilytica DSM 2522]